ncbi:MAG: RNase P modulator RnpM [Anaerolineae bacterium]
MAPKHIPLRTCVQCQRVRPKRELIRIVRTPQGTIEIDERGKAAGRGAYLCRNKACWEGAISRQRLDYALKTTLSPEDRERLLTYSQNLPCDDKE